MLKVGVFDARKTLGELLDRVERGEQIVITRHGRPVARLIPVPAEIDRAEALQAFQRIRDRTSSLRRGFDWERLKADRDAGRR